MAAGSITWDLLMRTASFETDTKKAEKRLRELQKEAKDLGKAMGVAVVAGASAMVYALKEAVDSADNMSKMAQKVGVTTEALSELSYAAKLSDVSMESLQAGMVKLAKGAAEGNDAFEAMGINVKDTHGDLKTTDVLMSEVAGKFANYKDGAEKTALAVKLFGKAGADMIPLLNSGADGLAEMAAEANALGIVIDGNTAKAAEQFNDNITRLQSGLSGIGLQVANALLPAMGGLTDQLVATAKNSSAVADGAAIIVSGFRLVASAVVIVGGAFKTLGTLIGGALAIVNTTVRELISSALAATTAIGKGLSQAASGHFRDAAETLSHTFDGYKNGIKTVAALSMDVGAGMVSNIKGTMVALDAVWTDGAAKAIAQPTGAKGIAAPLVKSAEDAEKARKKIADEAAKARKALEEEGARMKESVATPSEKRDSAVGNVNRLAGAGVIDPETQKRALADAESTYQEYVTKQRQMLTEGLLSEEDQIAASYERRKQMMLALTEATEQEKAAAIASLSEKSESEQAAARLARYRDVLTEEQSLTADYNVRRKQLEDDDTISAEQRTQYLTTLGEKYHASMTALDEADQKKKEELQKAQTEMVSQGFAGMADLTKAFAGEQSGAYQAMFAASKAFAIADITIKQSQAIAKAWGENNYWVAAGLTVGLAAQFAGLLSSTQSASFGGTRADGGPVNTGRSYLVGERGPEMFTPNQGGRIVPNDAMGSQQQAQPIRIVNAYDDGHIDDYLGSDSGERKIINAVRRNKHALGIA
jgi:uncharacterized protein YukJ/predicted nuclease with RNAse H fold